MPVLRKSAIDKSDCIKGGGGERSSSCAAGSPGLRVCVVSQSVECAGVLI